MSRRRDPGVFLWTCCYCGNPGMNVQRDPACVNCGVARCGRCHVEARNAQNVGSAASAQRLRARERNAIEGTDPLVAAGSFVATASLVAAAYGATSSRQDNSYAATTPSHGIADTETSDTQAPVNMCISTLTPPTSSVDSDAVEGFVHRILEFQSLVNLWPQLIERFGTYKRCTHVVEVLLKRYAGDLAIDGAMVSASNTSDSRLFLTAARFIRRSRIRISNKICEALTREMKNLGAEGAAAHQSIAEVPEWDIDQDEHGLKDDHLVFETIQAILFDKGPIISLQANIKLLISPWNPMETSAIYRLSSSIKTSIDNVVSSMQEPAESPGDTRLRYECVSISSTLLSVFQILLSFIVKTTRDMLINFICLRGADVDYTMTSKKSSHTRSPT